MAEQPIKNPLPADLPENWEAGQIVAPAGETVGLTEQHGYNYQSKQINDAQRAINKISAAFEDIGTPILRASAVLTADGWTGAAGDWKQSVPLAELEAGDIPDVYPATGLTREALAAYHSLADYADATTGVLTLYCAAQTAPSTEIPIQIVVMR